MRVFFDTSALTKRYVEEEGSEQIRALCAEADVLGVNVIVLPELISTLCRLVREGRLSTADYQSLKSAVQSDLSDADLCDLSQDVFEQALLCLERHPLRALDALHIGSALVYQPDLFVSADRRQVEAAEHEGLAVLDLSRRREIQEEPQAKVPTTGNPSRKVVASAWITLDGVFDAASMAEWLLPYHTDERGKIISEWILACDTYLLGRTTYEMLAPHWSVLKNNEMGIADKLNNVQKVVVSSTLSKAEWNNSTIIRENVPEEIARLKEQPGGDILIAGSATLVESLIAAGLIDEFRFLVHPILIGNGKRYFKDGMHTAGLKLVKNETLDSGVVFLCYEK